MSLYPQPLLDLHEKLTIDCFAGGGGASSAFEQATGRMVDIAINHDKAAVAMHAANHPQTRHLTSDIFEVDPREVCEGRPVGFLWASPDCTYHSKARGGKPFRSATRKRRALAHIVTRWAGQVRPDVIMLENVEEFADWGPLVAKRYRPSEAALRFAEESGEPLLGKPGNVLRQDGSVAPDRQRTPIDDQQLIPCKRRKSKCFRNWVKSLTDLGYQVEWRELRACDYGAPTIRNRLFLIARCDCQPITWPAPTHADPKSEAVKSGRLKPWPPAADCIDWTIPMCSIFATREEATEWAKERGQSRPQRPLADNTNRRIARGVTRYVLQNPNPYFVDISTGKRHIPSPLAGEGKGEGSPGTGKVRAPVIANCANSKTTGRGPNAWSAEEPLRTITSSSFAVASPILNPVTHSGDRRTPPADEPLPTITGAHRGEIGVVAPLMVPRYGEREGQNPRSRSVEDPSASIVPTANGAGIVSAHMQIYHGGGGGETRGQELSEPIRTLDTENRMGVVGAFLAQNNGGFAEGNSGDGRDPELPTSTITGKGANQALVGVMLDQAHGGFDNRVGRKAEDPLSTITTEGRGIQGLIGVSLVDQHGTGEGVSAESPARTVASNGNHHGLAAMHIQRDFGQSVGSDATSPIGTITADRNGHAAIVGSFLAKYYGTAVGQNLAEPAHTIPTVDRFGLVTVSILGIPYTIVDICMRMLQPRELYLCQGFRPTYIIDRGADGQKLTKTEQVHMCGNSVSPPVAEALVRANCPHLITRQLPTPKRRSQEAA